MSETMPHELPDHAALNAKHRAMCAVGGYPSVAAEIIPELGPALVEAYAVTTGDREG